MHLVVLYPQASQGVISMGSNAKVYLHLHQPMGDVKASMIELSFNSKYHGSEGTALLEGEAPPPQR